MYKLVKIQNISNIPYPFINNGDEVIGVYHSPIKIGYRFVLYDDQDYVLISTSIVEEIIDEKTFKTKNSIYRLVSIVEERDEKIDILIN